MKLLSKEHWSIFLSVCFASASLIGGLAFIVSQQNAQSVQAQDTQGRPLIGQVTVLYDAKTAQDTPETQGFLRYAEFPPGAAANALFANGMTLFDTTSSQGDSAGYGMEGTLALDRAEGYALHVKTRLDSEAHANNNRAGFSLIALSSDLQGIELGFWEDEVWAQEGGTTDLFKHAEGTAFNTTSALTDYVLSITNNGYSLRADATQVLSGTLRDYTAFSGFVDPYETANFIFLGDNSTSAQAKVEIAEVSVIVNDSFDNLVINTGQPLEISNIGIIDPDSSLLTLTLSAGSGNLTVSTDVVDGVPAGSISGNGGPKVVLSGDVVALNKTLSTLAYLADVGITGTDSLVVAVEDEARQSNTRTVGIEVIGGAIIDTPVPAPPTATTTSTPTTTPPTATTTATPTTTPPAATTVPLPLPSATPTPSATPGGTVILPLKRVFLPDVRK